jgi:arachidonate 15-lipoxygenase
MNVRSLSRPPTLPQEDSPLERIARDLELIAARFIYSYADPQRTGLPMPLVAGRVAYLEIPANIQWINGFLWNNAANNANDAANARLTGQSPWTLESYAEVFATVKTPPIVESWKDDSTFCVQRLAGLNPLSLARVTADGSAGAAWPSLQRRAPFGDEILSRWLGGDATFARAIAENRLYVADYALLGNVTAPASAPAPWQQNRQLLAPVALFIRPTDFAGLEPVGIAIDPQMLFSPADDDGRWEMAKLFVQSADYNVAQVLNHLCFTHLIEEAFCLASVRRLAWCHPIHRLLAHHFGQLLIINELGVKLLLSTDGAMQKILQGALDGSLDLMRLSYKNWSFADLDFEASLKSRGVDDAAALPYYPYRDDGRLIWNLLGNYLSDYVNIYYPSDAEVRSDPELQGWAQELAGLLDDGQGRVAGFPETIGSREQLAIVLRRIVWTAGPQHAAVNYPQVDFASYVPNMTAATYQPPVSQGPVSDAELLAMMAPRAQTGTQTTVSYVLAAWHYDQLLNYNLCSDDASQQLVTKTYGQLHGAVREAILARNRDRRKTPGLIAYSHLLPENIPNATSV